MCVIDRGRGFLLNIGGFQLVLRWFTFFNSEVFVQQNLLFSYTLDGISYRGLISCNARMNIQFSVLFCDTVLLCVTVFLLCIVLFIVLVLYCLCFLCMYVRAATLTEVFPCFFLNFTANYVV
jgi:hypothetical protein